MSVSSDSSVGEGSDSGISMENEYVRRMTNMCHSFTQVNMNNQPVSAEVVCCLSCTRAYFMNLKQQRMYHVFMMHFNGEMEVVPPRKYKDEVGKQWVPEELKAKELMEKVPLGVEEDRVFDIDRQLTAGTFISFDPDDFFDHENLPYEKKYPRICAIVGERSGYMGFLDVTFRAETCRFGTHNEPISEIKSFHNGQVISISKSFARFWKCTADEERTGGIAILPTHIFNIQNSGSLNKIIPFENLPRPSFGEHKEDLTNKHFISKFIVGTSHGKVFEIELPPLPTTSEGVVKSDYALLVENKMHRIRYDADKEEDEDGGLPLAFKIKKATVEYMGYCFGGEYLVVKSHRSLYLFRKNEKVDDDEEEGEGDDDDEEDEEEEEKKKEKTEKKMNFKRAATINLRDDFDGFDFHGGHPDILYFVGCAISTDDMTNEISFKEFRFNAEDGKFTCQNYLSNNAEAAEEIETSVKGRVVNPCGARFSPDLKYVMCGSDSSTSFFKFEVIDKKHRAVFEMMVKQDEERQEILDKYHAKLTDMLIKYKKKIKRCDDHPMQISSEDEEEEEEDVVVDEEEEVVEEEDVKMEDEDDDTVVKKVKNKKIMKMEDED